MIQLESLIDIYSAANTYPEEGRVLAQVTQRAAIRYAQGRGTRAEMLVLLAFANALGYLDDELYRALRDTF
jgi:hypothetical protein